MKNVFKRILALGISLLCLNAVYSASDPTTFLGPTAKGSYTDLINNTTAYSVLGEVGLKNFRLGGTLGWMLVDNQRVKVSADYLYQRITYPFATGNTDQWVNQGSISADYQYNMFGYLYDPQIDIAGFLSHAPNKSLSAGRRIAGSNAGGIAPGITIQPLPGTRAGVDLNYDNVRYDTTFVSNKDAKGLGGTAHVDQMIADNVNLGLVAAVRQPFNNYQANVTWLNVPYFGTWNLGVNGAYTTGKNTLPNTYNIGVSADYVVARAPAPSTNRQMAQSFLAWTGTPAVYLPQVLAIPDGTCVGGPVLVGTIPNPIVGDTNFTFDASPFFGGNNLRFSITVTPAPATGSITIDPVTGIITGTGLSQADHTAVITATNSCGSVSTTTVISIPD